MKTILSVAVVLIPLATTGCGDCAGVGLSRLGTTERTIAVGESFVATYEEGGSCRETADSDRRSNGQDGSTSFAIESL